MAFIRLKTPSASGHVDPMAHYAGMYGAMAPHSFGQPSLYYQGASPIEQPYATSFPYEAWPASVSEASKACLL